VVNAALNLDEMVACPDLAATKQNENLPSAGLAYLKLKEDMES
jgi:hypothetical protein